MKSITFYIKKVNNIMLFIWNKKLTIIKEVSRIYIKEECMKEEIIGTQAGEITEKIEIVEVEEG